ncbi:MAG: uncharacterized protein JWM76_5016 [Pseudonocardiales bacterium]|nr:uncharacterized protein [Pseudonocardiales bacterium]
MSLSEVGRSGQCVDLLNGGDVAADGRLLSVSEIQQAFQELVARKTVRSTSCPGGTEPDVAEAVAHRTSVKPTATVPGISDESRQAGPGVDLGDDWVCVVAAHAGAGASTVALAIADAADRRGQVSHLIDAAHPRRSGLIGATTAEMGLDPTGTWRRGRRGRVTIDRRASEDKPAGWPTAIAIDGGLVVVDLGLPTPENLDRLATSSCHVVVVCRPTVPGARLAEQLLTWMPMVSLTVVAVGVRRWPHEVTATLGPRLRELRVRDAVVAFPVDRQLAVTGPTNGPLPKGVAGAGRLLLGAVDAARSAAASADPRRPPNQPQRDGVAR